MHIDGRTPQRRRQLLTSPKFSRHRPSSDDAATTLLAPAIPPLIPDKQRAHRRTAPLSALTIARLASRLSYSLCKRVGEACARARARPTCDISSRLEGRILTHQPCGICVLVCLSWRYSSDRHMRTVSYGVHNAKRSAQLDHRYPHMSTTRPALGHVATVGIHWFKVVRSA